MKLLNIYLLKKQNYFQQNLKKIINNPNKPQKIPSEIKLDFKNDYGTGVVCTSGYDLPKGVR